MWGWQAEAPAEAPAPQGCAQLAGRSCWDGEGEAGAGGSALFERAVELTGEDLDDAEAEGFAVAGGGETDAIIFDDQLQCAGRRLVKQNSDGTGAAVGESVFEGIGQEFVEDQGAGNCAFDG